MIKETKTVHRLTVVLELDTEDNSEFDTFDQTPTDFILGECGWLNNSGIVVAEVLDDDHDEESED